ncbi:DNA polymerase delta small subunit, putative [Hepatocystis sp. ex Piliocolobus tephrosceles]|nr:DNA polymerase delta small subunit, putative [Hepatocystis sp. ex Piliocolobus tephrosceles]
MKTQVSDQDVNDIIKHVNKNNQNDEQNGGCEYPLQKKLKTCNYHYENNSKPFILINPTFTQQYAPMYNIRIKIMKPLLMKTINNINSTNTNTSEEQYTVLNYLKEIKINEKCYCVGTLFKKMELRPSILKEYLSQVDFTDNLINYSHDQDILFIEDETARIKLEGNINSDEYITGLTIIIKGIGMNNGSIYVEKLIYSYLPLLKPILSKTITDSDKYILFVSGLYISELNDNINNLSLFRNFILGLHGDKNLSENLLRVVIVGNSLKNVKDNENDIKVIDSFLYSLCQSVHIDLMPGEDDPCDAFLPQQPFPSLFFKKSKTLSNFQCVTNPYHFSFDNINICCMSGESVNNITSFSKNSNMDALKIIASSRILSPTAPDTMNSYPFITDDPFCLKNDDTYPHIFVNGNCTNLEIEYLEKNAQKLPLLICLPNFVIQPKVVLLNITNMEYKVLSFNVNTTN